MKLRKITGLLLCSTALVGLVACNKKKTTTKDLTTNKVTTNTKTTTTNKTNAKTTNKTNAKTTAKPTTTAHVHNFVNDTKTATCIEEGYSRLKCECGEITNTIVIPKIPHVLETDEAVAATCIAEGHGEGSHCCACEEVIDAYEVYDINPDAHEYEITGYEWINSNTNCIAKATCKLCKKVLEETGTSSFTANVGTPCVGTVTVTFTNELFEEQVANNVEYHDFYIESVYLNDDKTSGFCSIKCNRQNTHGYTNSPIEKIEKVVIEESGDCIDGLNNYICSVNKYGKDLTYTYEEPVYGEHPSINNTGKCTSCSADLSILPSNTTATSANIILHKQGLTVFKFNVVKYDKVTLTIYKSGELTSSQTFFDGNIVVYDKDGNKLADSNESMAFDLTDGYKGYIYIHINGNENYEGSKIALTMSCNHTYDAMGTCTKCNANKDGYTYRELDTSIGINNAAGSQYKCFVSAKNDGTLTCTNKPNTNGLVNTIVAVYTSDGTNVTSSLVDNGDNTYSLSVTAGNYYFVFENQNSSKVLNTAKITLA